MFATFLVTGSARLHGVQDSKSPPSWQPLPAVNYSGSPSTIAHDNRCAASCRISVNSKNFTVVGVAQSGQGEMIESESLAMRRDLLALRRG